jgi:hypothetical protein
LPIPPSLRRGRRSTATPTAAGRSPLGSLVLGSPTASAPSTAAPRRRKQRDSASADGIAGRPSQDSSGGNPRTDVGQQRTKLHVPTAADIAAVSADLLFGQPPSITVEDDQATQDRIDELIGEEVQTKLHEAAEVGAALGHSYLRVGWDLEIDPDGPLVSVVDADAAYPTYAYGRLIEVTFVREWNIGSASSATSNTTNAA